MLPWKAQSQDCSWSAPRHKVPLPSQRLALAAKKTLQSGKTVELSPAAVSTITTPGQTPTPGLAVGTLAVLGGGSDPWAVGPLELPRAWSQALHFLEGA